MEIILVDDEEISRRAIAGFLKDPLKHSVYEFDNCKDAFSYFLNNHCDLIISDIRMPGMNGIEFLKSVKQSKKDVKFILITGFGELNTSIEALREGAYDYILKPINVKELSKVLSNLEKSKETNIAEKKVNLDKKIEQYNSIYTNLFEDTKIGVFSVKMFEVSQLALTYHKYRDLPVLIYGETGTGKEIVARMVHHGSEKNNKPFISVNCSAINKTLFESEIFGYEKGAFTGASASGSKGKLELAQGGTIFFDEIGDLPLDMQPKLLRVLQEKEFYRVQGKIPIKLDVRFIFATNLSLEEAVKKEAFRQDLLYRINTAVINIPPLRERKPEIGMLALLFLKEAANNRNKSFKFISSSALEILENHKWYGNVRELKGFIERLVLLYDDTELQAFHLKSLDSENREKKIDDNNFLMIPLNSDLFPIDELEYEIAMKILKKFNGNISQSARYLNVSFRRFKRMAKIK